MCGVAFGGQGSTWNDFRDKNSTWLIRGNGFPNVGFLITNKGWDCDIGRAASWIDVAVGMDLECFHGESKGREGEKFVVLGFHHNLIRWDWDWYLNQKDGSINRLNTEDEYLESNKCLYWDEKKKPQNHDGWTFNDRAELTSSEAKWNFRHWACKYVSSFTTSATPE